jgi:nitrite reductase/ring-hydroxylating ferredoxin subunit
VTQPPHGLPPLGNTSPVWRRSWVPVAHSAEVPGNAPMHVLVAGDAWVITRMDGTLTAFDDQCPHRLSPLSAGCVTRADDGSPRLVCAAHGWRFDVTGYCDLAPTEGGRHRSHGGRHHARSHGGHWRHHERGIGARLVPAFGITERYGLIWLAAEEPLTPLPEFPQWTDDPAGVHAHSVRTLASAGQVLNSFLDTTPSRAGTVFQAGTVLQAGTVSHAGTVTTEGWQVTGTFDVMPADGTAPGYRAALAAGPHGTIHVRMDLPPATIGILFSCQPEDEGSTRVFTLITSSHLHGDDAAVDRFVREENGNLDDALATLDRSQSALLPLDADPGVAGREPLSLAWRRVMGRAVNW